MIKISKDEICISMHNTNTGRYDWINIEKTGKGLGFYLNDYVFLEWGLTFGELLNVLSKHTKAIDVCFESWSRGISFDSFVKECNVKTKKKADFDTISFYWGFELDSNMTMTPLVEGLIDTKDQHSHFSLDFYGMNEMKDCKVVLRKDILIFLDGPVGEEGEDVDGEEGENVIETRGEFTLHNLISSLLQEITTHGSPSERTELYTKIMADVEEMEEKAGGDEYRLGMYNRELSEALEKEDYASAAEIRDRIRTIIERNKSDKNTKDSGKEQ